MGESWPRGYGDGLRSLGRDIKRSTTLDRLNNFVQTTGLSACSFTLCISSSQRGEVKEALPYSLKKKKKTQKDKNVSYSLKIIFYAVIVGSS